MKRIILSIALALMAALLAACTAPNTPPADMGSAPPTDAPTAMYRSLTAAEAKARMDSGDPIIVVDVRTQSEYDEQHIPGAILIPNEEIGNEPPAMLPDLNAEILIYCRSGNRSRTATEKLVKMGYTNVYDFGGIINWTYDTVAGQ